MQRAISYIKNTPKVNTFCFEDSGLCHTTEAGRAASGFSARYRTYVLWHDPGGELGMSAIFRLQDGGSDDLCGNGDGHPFAEVMEFSGIFGDCIQDATTDILK